MASEKQAWSSWDSTPKVNQTEDVENLIGPHDFPFYSEKYNPKPLPKYKDSCTANFIFHNNYSYYYWIIDSGASDRTPEW